MATDSYFLNHCRTNLQVGAVEGNCLCYVDADEYNLIAGNTYQVLSIPERCFVRRVTVISIVAEGGSATIKVGDGEDDDGWDTDVDVHTASAWGLITVGDGAYATANGKVYWAADTIDIIPSDNLSAAGFWVIAEYFKLPDNDSNY